jgi:hypothetical protein
VRTSKPVVGAERSDVSDPDKAEKQYNRESAREDFISPMDFNLTRLGRESNST